MGPRGLVGSVLRSAAWWRVWRDGWVAKALVLLVTIGSLPRPAAAICDLGEFACNDGSCVAADQYCDGEKDCPDHSDEMNEADPSKPCTVCNRTYYGRVGKTYDVEVLWPRQMRTPQPCNLTLVAAGGPAGDLVQLAFHKFSLGKFLSHSDHGCPHGHMQIIENQRMYNPGYWCGDGVGLAMYYSETSTVSVILTMLPTNNDLTALDAYPSFYFKMSYKYLRRESAVVRYGLQTASKYRGLRMGNTVCDTQFTNCDHQKCYVQSPNFPGMYPRNTTCYYHLSQKESRAGKHAVIALNQVDPHLIHVKSATQSSDTKQRQLKLYEDCYWVGDYIRIYDGRSTRDPVLITFCRGDKVPEIVSSGKHMLIEFTSSPFDSPKHEMPWKHLSGFELKAEVRFLDKPIVRNDGCKRTIDSSHNASGWIEGVNHSVPPNSTCVWQFNGGPGQVVWLTFVYYYRKSQISRTAAVPCSIRMTVTEGKWPRGTLLDQHCFGTEPRTCERARRLQKEISVRPCDGNESYVSTGRNLFLDQHYGDASVITKVSFLMRYEFVDRRQAGEPTGYPCNRIIRSDGVARGPRSFTAPMDVFLYGRGGTEEVKCSWRLQGTDNQVVRLTINYIKTGSSKCRTVVDSQYAFRCLQQSRAHMALDVSEWPWTGVELPRACICSQDITPYTIESHGPGLTLNLTLAGMGVDEDYEDYFFNATYEFLDAPSCLAGTRILTGTAGEVVAAFPRSAAEEACEGLPWLLRTPPGSALFLSMPRASFSNGTCASDMRLYFHEPGNPDPVLSVCPAADPTDAITFFWPPRLHKPHNNSFGKDGSDHGIGLLHVQGREADGSSRATSLVVMWKPHRNSILRLSWLTTWPPYSNTHLGNEESPMLLPGGSPDGWHTLPEEPQERPCKELCPEIDACIDTMLWCDGSQHCPQGSDETVANCLLERVPWLYLTIAVLTLLTLLLITGSAVRRRNTQDDKEVQHLDARRHSTQESILPPKPDKCLSAYALDYTDMDFETTV